MGRFTEAQIGWVKENMSEMLHFFGYAKVASDPDNPIGFIDYGDSSDAEALRQYKGFLAQNQDMVDWVCQLTDQDLEQFQYTLYDPQKAIPPCTLENLACPAIMNHYEKQMYGTASMSA